MHLAHPSLIVYLILAFAMMTVWRRHYNFQNANSSQSTLRQRPPEESIACTSDTAP
jgi:hypothetical protein